MKIFGKEYGFAYTVGAYDEIKKLKEEHPEMQNVELNANVAIILSQWHERAESLRAQAEGREYVEAPLEMETIRMLTFTQLGELVNECDAAMKRDLTRTVETESGAPEKKTDKPAANALS